MGPDAVTLLFKEAFDIFPPLEGNEEEQYWWYAVSPLINLETQHDGRSARIG